MRAIMPHPAPYLSRKTLTNNSLVVWKRIPTDASTKHIRVIRILAHRAEIEDPKVGAVTVCEEARNVIAAVTVEPFKTDRGVSHDNDTVGDVG